MTSHLKNKKTILVSLFLGFVLSSFGQSTYPTRDSTHIFWQPNLSITYLDYKLLTPQKQVEQLMEEYSFSASASVGVWSILDIPKRKKDRYTKFEKVYFAPAFERKTSYAKTQDLSQIAMQNAYFDMCEVWARWARQKLATIQDTIKTTGTLTIFYMTVEQEMKVKIKEMFRSYFNDVFKNNYPNAFQEWRSKLDKKLEDTTKWATRPDECYRLMTGKPIDKEYIQAPIVIGVLK